MVKVIGPLASHHASGRISAPKIFSSSLRNRHDRQAPPAPPPPSGGSLLFTSTTDPCNAPTYVVPDTASGTLETWLYPTETRGWIAGTYYAAEMAHQSISWLFDFLYYRAYFNNKSKSKYASNPLTLNEWSHLAITWTNEMLTLWANGTDWSHEAPEFTFTGTNTGFTVGGYDKNNTHKFEGHITRIRTSDITRYTANFTPPTDFTPDANTTGLWRMTEGAGTTVADESGNDHTLDFPATNLPTWSDLIP